MHTFQLEPDLSEIIPYNLPDFPLYTGKGAIQNFENYTAACHWHRDLEFILALDGCMDYFINGKIVHLGPNEGVFVNSRRLHYGLSPAHTDCAYYVVTVSPALFGAEVPRLSVYAAEKFGSGAADYLMLTEEVPWQAEANALVRRLCTRMKAEPGALYRLVADAAQLCACVAEHIPESTLPAGRTGDWDALRRMVGFIQQHYAEKITLADIAASGAVCRSLCCTLFKTHLSQSPNDYLTQYRVEKSRRMLETTALPVSEIALSCGFQSASYFTQVFRRETGLLPRNCRSGA
ncbi:MAG: helix-turn-helix domain-containing protein [Hominenteromicrobium sp.]